MTLKPQVMIWSMWFGNKQICFNVYLRLMIFTAYSWPLCLFLHFLQTEKLPSPSGAPCRHSS